MVNATFASQNQGVITLAKCDIYHVYPRFTSPFSQICDTFTESKSCANPFFRLVTPQVF